MVGDAMLEIHAIYNFIGNDKIHNFHDFLQEHVRYAEWRSLDD